MNVQLYTNFANPIMRAAVSLDADGEHHCLQLFSLQDSISIHGPLEHLEDWVRVAADQIRQAKAETGIVALDAREPGWTPPPTLLRCIKCEKEIPEGPVVQAYLARMCSDCFMDRTPPTREPNDTPTPVVTQHEKAMDEFAESVVRHQKDSDFGI